MAHTNKAKGRIPRVGFCGLGLAALLFAGAGYVRAQVPSVDTSQPIVVKQGKPAKPKPAKFQGQVVSSTPKSITVRSKGNLMAVRTFTYAENLSKSNFQYGQTVEIGYAPGSDVAQRIKSKSPKAAH